MLGVFKSQFVCNFIEGQLRGHQHGFRLLHQKCVDMLLRVHARLATQQITEIMRGHIQFAGNGIDGNKLLPMCFDVLLKKRTYSCHNVRFHTATCLKLPRIETLRIIQQDVQL